MSDGNTVLIVGTGTIGLPLIGLLSSHRKELAIDRLIFHKHTPRVRDRPMLKDLINTRGAELSIDEHKLEQFRELELEPSIYLEEALDEATVIIDATPSGVGQRHKDEYYHKYEESTKGFMAQGSETDFGQLYAYEINDQIFDKKPKYVTIASCNTHSAAAILRNFAYIEGKNELEEGTFMFIRRANDVSQTEDFIASPEMNKHGSDEYGTHHAVDVARLFESIGEDLNIFSSAMKINTQYMHTMHFHLKLKRETSVEYLREVVERHPLLAKTEKVEQNIVFSFGRDSGHFGRLLNQSVIILPSLHVRNKRDVYGFAFTPQDGNSLFSSIAATQYFLHEYDQDEVIKHMKPLDRWLFEEV